uniref:Rho GTPase activating protein 26 n=1 Tax=Oryzias sinensis TaxID=183150 RepID=A0A8C7YKY0_9TELE
MGLPALEFSDCYLDSPQFRERLKSHEAELDKTNKFIKELIKDGKALVQALKSKFPADGRERVAVAAREAKKKYDKETEKYCGVLEKHLSLSAKKKEAHLHEADNQVDNVRQHFYEVSLEYVFKVQEVQERKMFDFVEPLLAFLQGLFTYYHHGYELAKDFNHFKTDLTISIQNTRNRFESTRSEVESLMRKMKENPHEHKSISQHLMEGYLFVLEKRSFVSTWVKYYCTYHREPKRVTMVLFDPKSGGKMGEEESFILKSCTRRKTDSIEKRFCFDVEAMDRPGVITMQALSEEDRRLWMEAMDGREPVGFHVSLSPGIDEQGLYRIAGVNSKVQKLLSLTMDPKTCADVELDSPEWEIKTITSAIKHYLRVLPAPLMTYQYQRSFIKAAKMDNPETRVTEIHTLVHRLPEKNRQMLELLVNHLANVASHHHQNLMTIANLGVVFGPTLLRPQEETVAAIMDIKFQNIVVEILIEHHERPNSKNLCRFLGQLLQSGRSSIEMWAGLLVWSSPPPPYPSPRPESSLFTCSPASLHPFSQTQPYISDATKLANIGAIQPYSSEPDSSSGEQMSHSDSLSFHLSSVSGRKAIALYACKAEHESELSFIAGTVFMNVHASREPGWLEGTLDGRKGLIPENYVEFL